MALRLPSLTVTRRAWFSEIESRVQLAVQLSEFLAVSPTGERVYLSARRDGDDHGIAVLDGRWRGEGFLGGFGDEAALTGAGVVEVEGSGGPRLAVTAGVRAPGAVRLMIYDVADLAVRDSVFVARPLESRFGFRLQGLVRARDGRHVHVLTVDSLLKVDVRATEVVARTRRARSNLRRPPMAVTTDPPRVFVGDRGSFDFPGSGELQVYDARDLGPVGTVQVTGSMNDIAVNREGDRVFVVAGTDLIGGFSQRASLSVVDAAAMTQVRTFEFERFGLKEVVAF